MRRSRFSDEQIIGILREGEANSVKGVCAKHNISEATFYVEKAIRRNGWIAVGK